ncbi:hypothetical protein BofuT4_uP152390.1 [Botrytis cinerea T4]|uniref:Uncharacterized protein n=1 Tax=Botryotinia fuckeliana (strain T4) TaxID=999810 RepID=G2YVM9_BOTF4|nr:hypothetical protein BofuT4_uP152390.1 [Botrytis cinerea T4]
MDEKDARSDCKETPRRPFHQNGRGACTRNRAAATSGCTAAPPRMRRPKRASLG